MNPNYCAVVCKVFVLQLTNSAFICCKKAQWEFLYECHIDACNVAAAMSLRHLVLTFEHVVNVSANHAVFYASVRS